MPSRAARITEPPPADCACTHAPSPPLAHALPHAHPLPLPHAHPARGGRSSGARVLSLLSAAGLVLMPKCPFCLIGWMGALGLGGLAAHATAIPIVLLVFFCASQAVFLRTARRTGDTRALVCAALGVAVVAGGYAVDAPPLVRWLGVALLVGASILNAVAMARGRRASDLIRVGH